MLTKNDILNTIQDLGFPDNEVAISLDDFFDNPNCVDAIGVNIYPDPPTTESFYQTFKELIHSKKADKIFVRISDADDPENWFFSDTIYVIGNLTLDELKTSIKELRPDEIYEEWINGKPGNIDDIQPGKKIYSIWWD
jgi:hypothetical protein